MHAIHPDPRVLLAAMAALVLALAAAFAPRALDDVSFGGTSSVPAPVSAPAAAPLVRTTPPDWVRQPLRSPLADLRQG